MTQLGGSAVEGEFNHVCSTGYLQNYIFYAPSRFVIVGIVNFLGVFSQICGN